jgi:NADPH:quinone reductase-like Zn-dependent oxidoreductase
MAVTQCSRDPAVRGRIVRIYKTGAPEVLQLEQAESGPLRRGEVLLQVHAFGLNNSEAQYRRGEYPMKETVFPTRLGRECCGTVSERGPGVVEVDVGDRVSTIPAFDVERHGVYGEWAVVPAQAVVRMPEKLTATQCASVWQQYLTAFGPLVARGSPNPGDWVLITAAASSVGVGAIQIAKLLGCRVIATTRSEEKVVALHAVGAEHVLVTPRDDLSREVLRLTGGVGARLIIDPIAGTQVRALCEAAAQEAQIFLYGQLAKEPVDFPLVTCMAKALAVHGYTLWELTLNAARRDRALSWIAERLADGRLSPVISRVFPLDDIVAAHRYLEAGRQIGKIVVNVS